MAENWNEASVHCCLLLINSYEHKSISCNEFYHYFGHRGILRKKKSWSRMKPKTHTSVTGKDKREVLWTLEHVNLKGPKCYPMKKKGYLQRSSV